MNDLQPIKRERFNQKKKISLLTAFLLISFQDSRHSIWHRDFRFSEGCSFFTSRGMAAMKAEEKESGKQPPIRNAQHLPCEYIRRPRGQNSDAASVDDTYFQRWSPHAFVNLLQFWLPAQWFLQSVSDHRGTYSFHWCITTLWQVLGTQQWASLTPEDSPS